ncbi:hypothetical protein CSUI_009207 [Cystoisospora suis]|uniref:Uncharacterized protein n=1 Tax=Cystoisospora suis TaxID=483139 RepID=A0A2C6KKN2_9APIC|nr:hypothetical protein CSUI_009207 [Cystoisospora suis]
MPPAVSSAPDSCRGAATARTTSRKPTHRGHPLSPSPLSSFSPSVTSPPSLNEAKAAEVTWPTQSVSLFTAPIVQPLFPPGSLFAKLPDAEASSPDLTPFTSFKKGCGGGPLIPGDDPASFGCAASQTSAEPKNQSISPEKKENQLVNAWVLGVAAAVWHVRGSRVSESYERELMRLHDKHADLQRGHWNPAADEEELMARTTASQFTAQTLQSFPEKSFLQSEDDGQKRAELVELRSQLAELERRRAAQAEKHQERYMNLQQQRVRCIQKLRNALLSGNHNMRALLQRLQGAGSTSLDVVGQLGTLLEEQERRLTTVYVQQVSRLQAVVCKALRKEGKLPKLEPAGGVGHSRDTEGEAFQRWTATKGGTFGSCGKFTKVSQLLFKNSNSSLRRRSSCFLRPETSRCGKGVHSVSGLDQPCPSQESAAQSSSKVLLEASSVSDKKQRRQEVLESARPTGLHSERPKRDRGRISQDDGRGEGMIVDEPLVVGEPERRQGWLGTLQALRDVAEDEGLRASHLPADCLSSEEGQDSLIACPVQGTGQNKKKARPRGTSTPGSTVASHTNNEYASSPGSDAVSEVSSPRCEPRSRTPPRTRGDRVRRSRKRSFPDKEASPVKSGAREEFASERTPTSKKREPREAKEVPPRVCVEELTTVLSAVSFVQLKKVSQTMREVHPWAFDGVARSSLTKKETLVRQIVRFVASEETRKRMAGWVSQVLSAGNTEELVSTLVTPPV